MPLIETWDTSSFGFACFLIRGEMERESFGWFPRGLAGEAIKMRDADASLTSRDRSSRTELPTIFNQRLNNGENCGITWEETKGNSGGNHGPCMREIKRATERQRERIILEKLPGIEKPWKIAIKKGVGR